MKTNLKLLALSTTLLGAAMIPHVASAQSILTVDVDKVYSDSAAGKSGVSQIQAKYTQRDQSLGQALQTAQTAFNTKIQAAQKTLGPNGDFSKLPPADQKGLSDAQDNYNRARQQYGAIKEEEQEVFQYVQQQILQKVVPITESIRSQRKAQAILVRGSVLAADPSADVTAQVISQLDAQFTTPLIVPPQQPAPGAAPVAPAATAPASGKKVDR